MIPIYATLGACAVVATIWVIRYDLYEREPVPMVVAAAIMGYLTMSIIGRLEDWTLDRMGGVSGGALLLAGIAATHEEIARFAIVALLALFVRSHFNDPMHGIVYGSIVGIGMAVIRKRGWPAIAGACLAGSIAIHWLWDWVAFAAADRGVVSAGETVAVIALMLTGIALYGTLIMIGARFSRMHFAPEDARSLWGWPFTSRN